jgi:hypothetical protein
MIRLSRLVFSTFRNPLSKKNIQFRKFKKKVRLCQVHITFYFLKEYTKISAGSLFLD